MVVSHIVLQRGMCDKDLEVPLDLVTKGNSGGSWRS